MPCIASKPGAARPVLSADLNFTVPGFSPPTFDAKACCKIHIPIPLPVLPPIPLAANPVFLTAINLVIGQVQAYIDQLDAIEIDCPLESAG